MLELRIHGRGGQGAQLACQMLAAALFRSGHWVQAFAAYGGERRGAPVTAYVRADGRPIRLRCDIERPHHLLVLDSTMLDERLVADVRSDGLVVANCRDVAPVPLPDGVHFVGVDAASIAERAGLGPIVSTAMVGAFGGATGLMPLTSVAAAVEELSPAKNRDNVAACTAAYLEAAGRQSRGAPG